MTFSHSRPKWRICIVDQHGLIRKGLKDVLAGHADMEVCGETDDANKAFNLIMSLTPDLVTTEISLPGNSGLELIKSIRSLNRNIGVLVISDSDEQVYAGRALRAGAHGFLHKLAAIGGIADAIRRILAGQLVFSTAVEQQMLERLAHGNEAADSPVRELTDRELEVGNLIGSGASTREIATRLGVSVKTIETHRAHIKQKLGLENGARLLQFWSCWACRTEPHDNPHSLPELAANGSNGNGGSNGNRALPMLAEMAAANGHDER